MGGVQRRISSRNEIQVQNGFSDKSESVKLYFLL